MTRIFKNVETILHLCNCYWDFPYDGTLLCNRMGIVCIHIRPMNSSRTQTRECGIWIDLMERGSSEGRNKQASAMATVCPRDYIWVAVFAIDVGRSQTSNVAALQRLLRV